MHVIGTRSAHREDANMNIRSRGGAVDIIFELDVLKLREVIS